MTSQNENAPGVQARTGDTPRLKSSVGKIFISYRHIDSAGHAGHIHEKLASHFGRDRIFMDVDNLPPGMRFDQHIQEVLGSCRVLLAVIGRYWLTLGNNESEPVIAPQGWMRTELGTALRLGVPIIPVLVHGATMPTPEQLPEDLSDLAFWQAVEIRDKNFQYDVEQLIKAITEIISSTHMDRYKLGRRLGGGRSGEVFYAEDTLSMGRTVAVKILHPHVTQDERLLRDYESCARAICALDSPSILRTYDIGQKGSCHFIVTEYFDGETLRNRMSAASPIRLLESIRIMRRVAEALSGAHKAGVIHGDIRPENVLVNSECRVKVFDFGLFELVDQIAKRDAQTSSERQEIVRLNYRSPEQLAGDEIDERTDVWNVGVMLYEVITERLPFDKSSVKQVRAAILNGNDAPHSFNTGEHDIDSDLNRIVGKALRRNRNERYQSAKELIAELDDLEAIVRIHFSRMGTGSSPERGEKERDRAPVIIRPTPGKDIRRKRYVLGITLLTLLIIAAGVGYYFAVGSADSVAIMPATFEGNDPMTKAIAFDITQNIQSNLLGLQSLNVKDASSDARTKFECRIELNNGELKVYAELREVKTGKVIAAWQPPYTAHVADWKVLTQQLAADIVNQLHVPLTRDEERRLRQRATFNREAAELYLAARSSWQKRTRDEFYIAITKYEQAIVMDPEFALAYVGLADCHHLLPFYDSTVSSETALLKAEAAINKALSLNDDLLEAYISRAVIRYQYKLDFKGAKEDFDRLLPSHAYRYATGWQWYSEFLLVDGKYDEANQKARIAFGYDQHSPIVRANLAYVAYYSRDFGNAVKEAYDAIAVFPYFRRTYTYLANALEQQGQYEMALTNFAEGGDPTAALYREAPQGKWQEFLKAKQKIQLKPRDGGKVQYYELAETSARLGQDEEALAYLRQTIDQKSNRIVFIGANPRFTRLCSPRFLDLVREVGVPAKICGE